MQEVRLVLCALAVVGIGGCSARSPQTAAPLADARREPQASAAYVVQPGDTLGWIAACSGLSVGEIAQLNRIPDPDLLLAGERLQLSRSHRCDSTPRPRATAAPSALAAARSARPALTARAESSRLLAAATTRLEAADFEKALSLAEACTSRLAPFVLDSEADGIRARCHLLAGMTAAGLEQRERAISEFRQAFAIDPSLELSPQVSPRILELVDAADVKREASR